MVIKNLEFQLQLDQYVDILLMASDADRMLLVQKLDGNGVRQSTVQHSKLEARGSGGGGVGGREGRR